MPELVNESAREAVQAYLSAYPEDVRALFDALRALLPAGNIRETLWARLPSYYCGERFVRLIPFRDHINVEAAAMPAHREALAGYKLTPKGMLQIGPKQAVPAEVLRAVFRETLGE